MNQEKTLTTQFSVTEESDGMSLHIEGGAQDLVNLLANAIYQNEEVETVITMALIAVMAKREEKMGDGNDENLLNALFSTVKPTAQA